VISIDIQHSGAGTVTPPAVGARSAGQLALTAPYAAPPRGTGLPFAGVTPPARLRRLGALIAPVQWGFAVVGVPTAHVSSTPGDLPPRVPLS
jgi:hypothetical protein